MSGAREQSIKLEENGSRNDYDPLDEATVEDRLDNEDIVVRK